MRLPLLAYSTEKQVCTSSISITLLGGATKHPENVCGMHFFNPPQLMPLVEIVKGRKTSEETVQFVKETSKKMGKETVLCRKDSPGFIVNRILVPALNEAVFLVQEEVADPEDIDKALKLGLNHPMGPFEMVDLVGLDTRLHILEYLHKSLGEKFRPSVACQLTVNLDSERREKVMRVKEKIVDVKRTGTRS